MIGRRLTRDRLARRVSRRLRRSGASDIRYAPEEFALHYRPAGATTRVVMYLANLFQEVATGSRRRRRARIAAFVDNFATVPGMPAGWAEACPLLRPVLRGAAPMTPGPGWRPPIRRPAAPYLSELVVVDLPDTMTYVTPDQVTAWGVTEDEVFAAARANLSARPDPPANTVPAMLRFVDDGNAYWTSHLLLEGWLAGLAERVGGRPVAFAPERATLLVVADGAAALPELFTMVEDDYRTAPRAISPVAYVSDEQGRTVPYEAPPGHPLHEQVRRAERVLAVREYALQARSLVDAADLDLAETPDGVLTRTRWAGAGTTLLPTADEVEIAEGDRWVVVPWADLSGRDLVAPVPDLDPGRWRATRPVAEVLAALRR